ETQPETDEPEPVTEKPEPTEAEDDAVYFDPGDVSGDWLAWTWIDGGEGFWIQGSDENGVLKFEGVSSNVLFVNTSDGDWSGRVGQTDVLDTVYGGTYKLDGSESDSDDGFGNAIVLYGGDWTEETQPETDEPATDEPATDEPATDEPEPTEAEETQKVYFTNNQNWGGTIYCYYWTDGDETPVEWPGIEMKDEGVNKYGEPYYSVELPVGVNVVFTNSKAQTTEGKFTGKESGFYPLSEKDDRGFWLLESWTEEETEPATDEPEPTQPATYDPEVFKNAVTIDDSYFGNDGGIVLLWTWYEGDIDSHWVETVGNNVFTDIADAFVILRTSEDTLAEFKKDYPNWRTSDALFSYGSYQSGDIDTRVNETFKITGFGNGVISPHDETMVIYGLTGNWVGDEPIPETEEPETEPFTDEPTTPENKNWIVAGSSAEVFGTMWDPANTDNKMKKGSDGLYSITYSNVAAGEYEFKVTNGSWDECYGAENGANFAVNLEENSNITIKFNAKTKEISVAAESAQEPTEPETQKPTEPETQEPTEPETQEPTQPEDKGVISVGNAKALKGNTVEVPINIEKNPGIVGMTLKVNYPSALTLTEVKDGGILGANTHKPQLTSPYTLSWANDTANENYTATGTIATLVFKINDDAEVGNYNVEISYNKGNFDIYNKDMDEVGFTINNGKVEVIDYIIGDVNGDRKVNNLDRVYLTRHLADWDGYKEINKAAADLDGNGVVNNLDRVILTRHLADWAGYESLPYKK
ncbi:MAG: starch-binding protein, partial [Ruminococcus sp.]|nr:starch-binding protein [Ruminococcus sp.]